MDKMNEAEKLIQEVKALRSEVAEQIGAIRDALEILGPKNVEISGKITQLQIVLQAIKHDDGKINSRRAKV